MSRVFAIGDVHGHFDRLEALLLKAGLVDRCDHCDGTGEVWEPQAEEYPEHTLMVECGNCYGEGWARVGGPDRPIVVQLGDLGHFGVTGSPTGDLLCWQQGLIWLDVILWGNHDRAVFDPVAHSFTGYVSPGRETKDLMDLAYETEQLRVAYAAHGYLLTHAGLHKQWKHQKGVSFAKDDPEALAAWLNEEDRKYLDDGAPRADPNAIALVAAIGYQRGGRAPAGGVLWRDASESLYDGFPQVFGHTKGGKIRQYQNKAGHTSYCVDLGSPDNGRLAGAWLPDLEFVEVP
jgi:hypothetical protein